MVNLPIPSRVETERLLLQRLRYEDAEEIFYSYASKSEATWFVTWPTHRSVDDTRAFLRHSIAGWNSGFQFDYSIRLGNGMLVGSIGCLHHDGRIQLGYIMSPTHWGNGYASEACSQILSILGPLPYVYRVGTFVDLENIASIKVLKKCGMVEEAILPQWHRFVNQGNKAKDCVLFRAKP